MLNTFFQGGEKFCRGAKSPLRPPGYGPDTSEWHFSTLLTCVVTTQIIAFPTSSAYCSEFLTIAPHLLMHRTEEAAILFGIVVSLRSLLRLFLDTEFNEIIISLASCCIVISGFQKIFMACLRFSRACLSNVTAPLSVMPTRRSLIKPFLRPQELLSNSHGVFA